MTTQLYDKTGNLLYPVVSGDEIEITWSGNPDTNLVEVLKQINSSIIKNEDGTSKLDLTVSCYYLKTNLINSYEVGQVESQYWNTLYTSPDDDNPYVWKKTVFRLNDEILEGGIYYELVSSNLQDRTQTIYATTSGADTITVELLYKKDEEGNYLEDDNGNRILDLETMNDDLYLPGPYDSNSVSKWSFTPKSIAAETPNVYMATRTKTKGVWGAYSEPYQFGKWAYDSTIKTMFQITDSMVVPQLNRSSQNPNLENSIWIDSITEEFTGYLWMITATSVAGTLTSVSGLVWSEPTLISIVK